MPVPQTSPKILALLGSLGLLGALPAHADPGGGDVDLSEGLVALYDLDGDAGDAAGALDGVVAGDVSYDTGVCGQAIRLHGWEAYVEIPAQSLGDFTVSAWFYQDYSTGGWTRIWDLGSSGGAGGGFFLAADHGRLSGSLGASLHTPQGGIVDVGTGIYPRSGEWNHVVVSYDQGDGGMTVYVDGVEAGSSSFDAQSFSDFHSQRWYLGRSNWADPYFAGLIDQVRIYDRALGADAAAGLYAEGELCDTDGDGIPDVDDGCRFDADQGVDGDTDGLADACDACPAEDSTGHDGDEDGCIDDTDGDGVPDPADACPSEDASGYDHDDDGCIDIDSDGDGVPDSLDRLPGYGDDLDLDGDGIIEGAEVDFVVPAARLTITGAVPASCTGADGVYTDILPVAFRVGFPAGAAHDTYIESWYQGSWYGSYSMWSPEWSLSVGASLDEGTFDSEDYYNAWYQGQDAYYGEYVSAAASRDGLYMSLSTYDEALFGDVRDHAVPGTFHLDGFELYGDFTNAAADLCAVSWYGYGPTWGYADLDGFAVVIAGDADADGEYDDEDSDIDGDGVSNEEDVFPLDAAESADADGDGQGDNADLCRGDNATGDADGDRVCDDADRFPADSSEWADGDSDGVGDNADRFPADPDETGDEDSDQVGDNADLCSGFPNVDTDSDQVCDASDRCPTDAADTDADNDDICDVDDLCVGQDNVDSDGDQVCDDLDLCVGNDATGDDDQDGWCVSADNCPADADATQADADADGIGDACEADGDRDGAIDDADNCPAAPNADQSDLDGDLDGDACDEDDDADGVKDAADNCPFYANASQRDIDRDGHGNVCDGDDDGDSVGDEADSCPGTPLRAPFDTLGCSGEQRVELVCGEPGDYGWARRGKYTACVTKEATSAYRAGLLTKWEKALLIARSLLEVWIRYVSVLLRWC